jgi:LuxR family maltose regulon positive regulatory protein
VLLRHAGDEIGARRELHRAIGVAVPAGLMQVLLEETEALGESLGGELLALKGGEGATRPAAVGAEESSALAAGAASSGPGGVSGVALGPGVAGAKGARASGGTLAPRLPGGSLTPREVEILTLVGEGLSNAEIGHRLSLVEGSVKWHLQRIYDKIGTRRRLVAVDRARRMGVFR